MVDRRPKIKDFLIGIKHGAYDNQLIMLRLLDEKNCTLAQYKFYRFRISMETKF